MTASHVCLTCGGKGNVRVRGQSGWIRVPCPACGGSGSGLRDLR